MNFEKKSADRGQQKHEKITQHAFDAMNLGRSMALHEPHHVISNNVAF